MKYFNEYEYGVLPYVPGQMEEGLPAAQGPSPAGMPGNTYENTDPWLPAQTGPAGAQRKPSMPADFFPYSVPNNFSVALDIIRDSLGGEEEDRVFYTHIINATVSPEDREILYGIRNDEMKHYEILKKLYYELTGEQPPGPSPAPAAAAMSYCRALVTALRGEVEAIGRYRKILSAMRDRRHLNMVAEILTDEIRHADLYGLLISMNHCFGRPGSM